MKFRNAALAAAAVALAGCGSAAAHTVAGAAPTSAAQWPKASVSAVPGTHNNTYIVGPFKVTLVAEGRLPASLDTTTESGANVPQYGATVTVKNISKNFTGWVSPTVEFVKGHSLAGLLLDTEEADARAGEMGGMSDPLAPGQSETLYAVPQTSYAGYTTDQLTQVAYGVPGTGTANGATTIQLRFPS